MVLSRQRRHTGPGSGRGILGQRRRSGPARVSPASGVANGLHSKAAARLWWAAAQALVGHKSCRLTRGCVRSGPTARLSTGPARVSDYSLPHPALARESKGRPARRREGAFRGRRVGSPARQPKYSPPLHSGPAPSRARAHGRHSRSIQRNAGEQPSLSRRKLRVSAGETGLSRAGGSRLGLAVLAAGGTLRVSCAEREAQGCRPCEAPRRRQTEAAFVVPRKQVTPRHLLPPARRGVSLGV